MSIRSTAAQASQIDFLSNRPMTERAEQLTKISPAILKEAERAAKELAALITDGVDEEQVPGKQRRRDAGRPQLTPPRLESTRAATANKSSAGSSSASPSARSDAPAAGSRGAGILLASLMSALEQADLGKLAFNAHSTSLQKAALHSANAALVASYQTAINAVTTAVMSVSTLQAALEGLNASVDSLGKQLVAAESILAGLMPDTPAHQAALQTRNHLQDVLSTTRTEQTRVTGAAKTEVERLPALQQNADQLLTSANASSAKVPQAAVQKDLSNIGRMLALMTQLGELMLKSGETRSETQRALLKIQEDARVSKLAKDAEKADKEMAKAEALNKAMGCIGKILGGILTAIAIIGAVFTGGASLVLAGIGLALMLADEVYSAVTGNSFIQEALKPIMKLLQPLLQFVMDKVAGLLEEMGVDAQTAKMAAMIAVSIAIAVAVVALMVTGAGSAVAKLASSVMSKLSTVMSKVLEKTISKLIPEIVKRSVSQMARQISTTSTRMIDAVTQRLGMSTDVASKQIYAQNLGRIGAGTNLGKTAITSGLEVGVQTSNQEVAKINADMKLTLSEMELVSDMFANLLEQFRNSFAASQGFFVRASDAINQHTSTGVSVARAISGTRAA